MRGDAADNNCDEYKAKLVLQLQTWFEVGEQKTKVNNDDGHELIEQVQVSLQIIFERAECRDVRETDCCQCRVQSQLKYRLIRQEHGCQHKAYASDDEVDWVQD